MLHSESIRYLEQAGFHYKPAESPDLWSHLESHFSGRQRVGPKFTPLPATTVAELISMGEEALLDALVSHHKKTGNPGRVARVIELPYVVGTAAAIPCGQADPKRVLQLIENAGTPHERVISVTPVSADDMPCTSSVTVTGGLYPDGRTAGYYDLFPGNRPAVDRPDEIGAEQDFVYLATREEIMELAREMELKADEISSVSREEWEAMIIRANKFAG